MFDFPGPKDLIILSLLLLLLGGCLGVAVWEAGGWLYQRLDVDVEWAAPADYDVKEAA